MADLVVKTNWLNQALQNLSLVEIRVLQLAIVDARETGQGLDADTPLAITSDRYANAFGINKKNAYEMLKSAEETLFNRRFTVMSEDEAGNPMPVKSRWLSQVGYLDGRGELRVWLSPIVVKAIIRIDGAVDFFTQYLLKNTIHFKSVYSVRLYELLKQWQKSDPKKIPMFELQKLRGQLGIADDEYLRMGNFKQRVLDKAVTEINEHSDLEVSYTQRKKGRVIIGFNFKIKTKPKEKDITPSRDLDTPDMFHQLTEKQINFFGSKLANDDAFGSKHAKSGESMKAFENRIKQELTDLNNQKNWIADLQRVGYKLRAKKG